MNASELQDDVYQVTKKFVGSSMGVVSFGRDRIFTEMLLQNMLGWCVNIVLTPTLETKRCAKHVVREGVRMDPAGDGLRFGVRSCNDVKVPAQVVLD